MTIVGKLGPPEYAAIITACLCAIVILNKGWVNNLRPSVKFQALAPEMEALIPMISMQHDHLHGSKALLEGQLEELRQKLRQFQIELPEDRETLLKVLPYVWACARNRNLKEARCTS